MMTAHSPESYDPSVGYMGLPLKDQILASAGIVKIGAYDKQNNDLFFSGTGFFANIGPEIWLFTAYHVIEGLEKVCGRDWLPRVWIENFQVSDESKVVRVNLENVCNIEKSLKLTDEADVAALPVDNKTSGFQNMKIKPFDVYTEPLQAKQPVYVGGHPEGRSLEFCKGELRGSKDKRSWFLIEHTAGTFKGNSGSPVLTTDGKEWRVIAIHHSGFRGNIRTNQATLISYVSNKIQKQMFGCFNNNAVTSSSIFQSATVDELPQRLQSATLAEPAKHPIQRGRNIPVDENDTVFHDLADALSNHASMISSGGAPWRRLAGKLYIPRVKIMEVEGTTQSEKCRNMFDLWLEMEDATPGKLIDALREIRLPRLAKKVEDFCATKD